MTTAPSPRKSSLLHFPDAEKLLWLCNTVCNNGAVRDMGAAQRARGIVCSERVGGVLDGSQQ